MNKKVSPQMESKQRLFVVLGMHRSGTSAITRALQALGVSLGDNLMASSSGENDKGFWEDNDVYQLNVELLTASGHDWHTLAPVLPEHLRERPARERQLDAAAMLRGKLAPTGQFGMKDPRLPRLLPFWQDVFRHLQAEVCYLIVVRNPISVAKSLRKRNDFAEEKSFHLWFQHMWSALQMTSGARRIIIDYDLMMDEPVRQLARIASNLQLPFDPEARSTREYAEEFLDGQLRHTRYTAGDLALLENMPSFFGRLYELLLDMSADRLAENDAQVSACISELEAPYRDHVAAWQFMARCESDIAARDSQLEQCNRSIEQLQNDLAAERALVAGLREHVAHEQRQVEQLNSLRADLEQAIAEKNVELVGHVQRIVQMADDLSVARARIDYEVAEGLQRQQRIDELSVLLEQQRTEQIRVAGMLEQVLQSRSWRLTRPVRAAARMLRKMAGK